MMRRFRSAAALGAVLALAACGSSGDTIEADGESVGDVAKKVAASEMRPRAGQWQSTVAFEKLDLGDAPPEARKMIEGMLGQTQTFTSCLTPEEAAKPSADFFQKGADNCKYETFSMGGGKIDAKMVCNEGSAGSQTAAMSGTYSPDDYAITVNAKSNQAGMPVNMTMSVKARRTGECTGKEG